MKQWNRWNPSCYGWADEAREYEQLLHQSQPLPASDWTHERKVKMLSQMVDYYATHQQADGAIIDPYSQGERYYSTPSYALAAAVLVSSGREDLIDSAASALTHSIELLVSERTPDQHPDFFIVMIMGAYRILKEKMPAQAERWRQALATIEPEQTYLFTMSKMKNPNRMINWNAIMLSGEVIRQAEGIASNDTTWIDDYLQKYHLPRFTSLGWYEDGPLDRPNSPFAYDIATRYHLGVMMLSGYAGTTATALQSQLQHGAISSLLTLSPLGELPPRGRSAQHQWNEAAAAFVFTMQAQQAYADGALQWAGAFRRAADKTWTAIEKWQTSEGYVQIVRNHFPAEQRHGYEVYSNHTTYNLWTAAALAYTLWYEQPEEIPPYPIPAELGSRTLQADGWFETVFSSVPDQQIVIHTALNDPYMIPGIARIQRAGLHANLATSSPGHRDQGFTEFNAGDIFPLIHMPAWQTADNVWHHLAEGIPTAIPFDRDAGVDPSDGGGSYRIEQSSTSADHNHLVIRWQGPLQGINHVVATYEQSPGHIVVTYEVVANDEAEHDQSTEQIKQIGSWIPLFLSDGQALSRIKTERIDRQSLTACAEQSINERDTADKVGSSSATMTEQEQVEVITVTYRDQYIRIVPRTPQATITFPNEANEVASRNGLLRGARIEATGSRISFDIFL